jgi:DNA invertase Pin-like site-specific DNA recombinase
MAEKEKRAIAYMRTSSASNVGADKDSDKRQRAALEAFAKASGYAVKPDDWFYEAAVKGADPVTSRPGFAAVLERIKGNGVRTILVESPDRFARDLAVQLAGHDFLKREGITLIPTSSPDHFTEDTPTATLVRQVLGAIAQFEKASLVARMRVARDRKIAQGIKCGGRRAHAELRPDVVALAKDLRRKPRRGPRPSLRDVSRELAERGHVNAFGRPFSAASVRNMLGEEGGSGKRRARRVENARWQAKAVDALRHADAVMPVVRKLQAAGATSLRAIARGLAERGVATLRGGRWEAAQVRNLLRAQQG